MTDVLLKQIGKGLNKMKTIVFLRTAPYSYKLPEKTLYQSLDEIGLQIADPSITDPSSILAEHNKKHC